MHTAHHASGGAVHRGLAATQLTNLGRAGGPRALLYLVWATALWLVCPPPRAPLGASGAHAAPRPPRGSPATPHLLALLVAGALGWVAWASPVGGAGLVLGAGALRPRRTPGRR